MGRSNVGKKQGGKGDEEVSSLLSPFLVLSISFEEKKKESSGWREREREKSGGRKEDGGGRRRNPLFSSFETELIKNGFPKKIQEAAREST